MHALKTGLLSPQRKIQTNLLLCGCFRKGFITHSFCKWPLYTCLPLNASTLARFQNTWKRMNQGKTQCWALFVISKATFSKTAIKKNSSIAFLKHFHYLIIVLLNPRISCRLKTWWLLKLSNMGANVSKYRSDVIEMDISFPVVPSSAQHQILMQHARIYRVWLPSEIFPKYGNVVERVETINNYSTRARWIWDDSQRGA